jgi:tetratricopeptide (TPR) repeat protein
LELGELDGQDSAILLAREAGLLSSQETLEQIEESQRQTVLELTRELHGVPIAIALAGRYLRMTGSTVQSYLSAFRDALTPTHLPIEQYGSAIEDLAIVCEKTFSYIQKTNLVAFERLQMSVFLLPEAIPTLLFSPQAEQDVTDSTAERVDLYSGILVDAGLLTTEQPFLRMHSLVQQTIRQSLSEEQQQRYIQQILRFFYQKLPVLQAEPLPIRLCVADHVRHLASLSESESAFSDPLIDSNEAGVIFAWASLVLLEVQLVDVAEPLLRRAVKICSHTLGEASPLVATFLIHLATMNLWLKNYEDAERFAHRAITSKTDALGIAHPDVLLALRQLGQIYAEQGKVQQARQCYEKAVAIEKSVKLHKQQSGEKE